MTPFVRFTHLDEIPAQVGSEVYVTEWQAVTQERIHLFAQATGDFQWIHVDEARAAKSSPYGGTIAHGFLTLSLLGRYYEDYLSEALPFCDMGVNYGLNKVRFTHPVRANDQVRGRFLLMGSERVEHGVQLSFRVTVEIKGRDKPACVAESVVRRLVSAS
jgi:acyl dehydratase